jgi:hypothetical protein
LGIHLARGILSARWPATRYSSNDVCTGDGVDPTVVAGACEVFLMSDTLQFVVIVREMSLTVGNRQTNKVCRTMDLSTLKKERNSGKLLPYKDDCLRKMHNRAAEAFSPVFLSPEEQSWVTCRYSEEK